MNLDLSDEQRMLRDSVDRFVAQQYDFAARKRIVDSPTRFSPEIWRSMAEFGWLSLAFPERFGGLGGGAVDIGIVMEGLGKGLVLEPVCTSSVLVGQLIARQATSEQALRWLTGLGDGSTRAVFAHTEAGRGPYIGEGASRERLATRAVRTAEGWRLQGHKRFVFDAPGADFFVVSAQRDDTDAIGLFIVAANAASVTSRVFDTLDGAYASDLRLSGVDVTDAALLGAGQDAAPAIDFALDFAVTASCAQAVGNMQVLLDNTVAYTKTRTQFGRPLASNQVLSHRMVNMAVACEEARAISLRAALHCDAQGMDARVRGRAVSGAKVKVADGARFVAESAVQLHGAMGVTEELNIGAYFKRLLCFEMSLGTRAEHLDRCVALRAGALG